MNKFLIAAAVVVGGGALMMWNNVDAMEGSPAVDVADKDKATMERNVPPELMLTEDDIITGDITAPVQIVEYASMTCGHCADFHENTYKKIKSEYIDSGKVVFALREMPWDNLALAVSKVIRCAPEGKRMGFADAFFSTQKNWVKSGDPIEEIKKVARLGGLSADKVEACINDENIHNVVMTHRSTGQEALGVKSTPTIFVNNKKVEGAVGFDVVQKVIEIELGQ